MRKIPTICPSCDTGMHVYNIRCKACNTEISGEYAFPLITRLSETDQDFITKFILASGSLKEIAKHLEVSYPTVRNILDEVIVRIQVLKKEECHE